MKLHRPLILLTVALLAGCAPAKEQAETPPRAVLYSVAPQISAQGIGPFIGTIAPRTSVALAFEAGGRLVSRNVDTGDSVEQGEALASLDNSLAVLQRQSAEADVQSAQIGLEGIRANEQRAQSLFERDLVTTAQLEEIKVGRQSAEAQLAAANANFALADTALSNTSLVAPFTGIVTAVAAQVGDTVGVGTPVLTLAQPEVKDAVIDVPEAIAKTLAIGDQMAIALEIDRKQTATGTIREISATADFGARTLRIRLALETANPNFRLGTLISATSSSASTDTSIAVPGAAILTTGEGSFVWLVDPTALTVRRVTVTVAISDGVTRVSGDIAPGALIVLAGVNQLSEGQAVRLSNRVIK